MDDFDVRALLDIPLELWYGVESYDDAVFASLPDSGALNLRNETHMLRENMERTVLVAKYNDISVIIEYIGNKHGKHCTLHMDGIDYTNHIEDYLSSGIGLLVDIYYELMDLLRQYRFQRVSGKSKIALTRNVVLYTDRQKEKYKDDCLIERS